MHCCGEQARSFVAQRAELPGPAPFIAGVCSFLDPDPEGHMFFLCKLQQDMPCSVLQLGDGAAALS